MDYGISHSYDEAKKTWDVKLTGEFDIFNAANLKTELSALADEVNADFVLDCSALDYMDSTAIGSLVAVLKNVKAYGGKIALNGLKPNLLKLFRITSLNKVFEIEGESDE